MKARSILLSIVLIALVTHSSQAQWVKVTDPGNRQFVGTLVAIDKNIFALAADPTYGGQFGSFGDSLGIFRSSDRGVSWTEADSGLPFGPNPLGAPSGPLALAADGPNLFAEAPDTNDVYKSIYISTNNGAGWQRINTGFNLSNIWWLFASEDKVFAIADTGMILSTDAGKSWTFVSLPNATLFSFAEIGNDIFFGTHGIFRSTNNGVSWDSIDSGLPLIGGYYPGIGALGAIGTTIFAGARGVFISTNNGTSWAPANTGLPTKTSITTFAESGSNIFATTANEIFLSTNVGENWNSVSEGFSGGYVNSLLLSDTTLFVATGDLFNAPDGVWRRPLSQMISSSAVSEAPITHSQIQIFPNPLSQSTTISFSTPQTGPATVTIVNLLGSVVARLFSGELTQGEHSFTWGAQGMTPGMYECIVRMGGKVEHTELLLTK